MVFCNSSRAAKGMGSMIRFSFLVLVSFALITSALADKKAYIVYLGGHSHGRDASPADHDAATASHHDLLGSFLGSRQEAKEAIIYSYNKHINGFAAILEEEEANQISDHAGVVSVFPDKLIPLHTTRSWQFLSLEGDDGVLPPASAWKKTRYGQDVIIGNVDTGVWPESKSFGDSGMGPVPARWRGSCHDKTKDGVRCNKKLIGAKFFNKGYKPYETYHSSRDMEGHGTHTLSTAGGSFVENASTFGFANGTAKGGSPGARLAAYKVCVPRGCSFSNIMAAIDEAIYDGVDVLSVSLAGDSTTPYSEDGLAISAFHAVREGVVVVASAGNKGPSPRTVSNTAPWIMTVGASTMGRDFPVDVYLGDIKHEGATLHLEGQGATSESLPEKKSYPLIAGEDAAVDPTKRDTARYCLNETALGWEKVRGKILVCLRGNGVTMEKGLVARRAGAVGMLLLNTILEGDNVLPENHFLPAAHLSDKEAQIVASYIHNTESPLAYIAHSRTRVDLKPAPVMVDFSSRGPNCLNAEILKPDVTAPGKWVLAAYPSNKSPSGLGSDTRRVEYALMSGTSMSCPHVSGVAGLVKSKNPHWSPAAVRSAIMTTATTKDNTGKQMRMQNLKAEATPLDYGAGHVQPNKETDPGLVYDLSTEDYLKFLCFNGFSSEQVALINGGPYSCPSNPTTLDDDLNYPSITVIGLHNNSEKVATRTLKNVGDSPATYRVHVRHPEGVHVSVKPTHLHFSRHGEEKRIQLTFTPTADTLPKRLYAFGEMVWSDGAHRVRSPLVVKNAALIVD